MADPHNTDPEPTLPERPLLSEIGARLAQALRGLRGGGSIRESLEEVIEESARQTDDISPQERMMLANLLKFGELKVSDVMVPRADIVAVEEKTALSDLVAVFREAQHSRLPIYRETLDDPVGMVHIKDILTSVEIGAAGELRWPDLPIIKFRRDVLFVPGSMPTLDLLLKMQTTRMHMALVIDEYGGTDGLVTIEDLVEQIVGDIDDEHDDERDPEIVARPDGSFDADGRVSLDAFKERTGIDFIGSREEEGDIDTDDIDTLAGLVFSLLGRVPARGEIVPHPSAYEFEVLEADPRRIKRLRIRPIATPKPIKAMLR